MSEWPICVEKDAQLIRGSSDMSALQDDGFYIIDHKFLGHDTPRATVETYAEELRSLAQAVEKLCGKKSQRLHFALSPTKQLAFV